VTDKTVILQCPVCGQTPEIKKRATVFFELAVCDCIGPYRHLRGSASFSARELVDIWNEWVREKRADQNGQKSG